PSVSEFVLRDTQKSESWHGSLFWDLSLYSSSDTAWAPNWGPAAAPTLSEMDVCAREEGDAGDWQ
ncbi:MAG: hypothetical protein P8Y42_19320, partial [Exilibacterium sp.]